MHCAVALIKNAVSNKLEKKDILKVDEVIDLDFDLLGYIAPADHRQRHHRRRHHEEDATRSCPRQSPAFSSVRIPGASPPSSRSWSMSSS